MATIYKIHPAIGVARVGTSTAFYIAPEASGELPTDPTSGSAVTSFRDGDNNLLRQGQRFRVFSYDSTNPDDPGTEVTIGTNGVAAIEWTVYLANKKAVWYEFQQLTGSGQEGDPGYLANGANLNPLRNATITDTAARQALILDPGPRTVGGPKNPSSAEFTLTGDVTDPSKMLPEPVTSLGSLQLDSDGNLIVIGGNGASGTTNINPEGSPYKYVLLTYANNCGWFDSVADGPVTAAIVFSDNTSVPVDTPAWCLSVPPKYAPQIVNLVTLYDLMYDVAVREMNLAPSLYSNGQFNPNYAVDVQNEILPLIQRPANYQWVADFGPYAVSVHEALLQSSGSNFPISRLRDPQATSSGPDLMPRLAGDNPISELIISKYLTVTPTQYFLLQQFEAGVTGGSRSSPPQPAQLDRAALDNCVGGAFCPGIEMTWISRNPSIYAEPFRLRMKSPMPTQGNLSQTNGSDNDYSGGLEPGDIVKYMAQPWQADFNQCSTQSISDDPGTNVTGNNVTNFWWWPAERPYFVFQTAGGAQVDWTRGFAQNPDPTPTVESPNVGDMQMVVNWKDLGFIVEAGDAFLETERNDDAIDSYSPPTGTSAADRAAASRTRSPKTQRHEPVR